MGGIASYLPPADTVNLSTATNNENLIQVVFLGAV